MAHRRYNLRTVKVSLGLTPIQAPHDARHCWDPAIQGRMQTYSVRTGTVQLP